MAFHDRLREARIVNGLTQKQLAQELGIAGTTVTGYEKGNSEPNVNTIGKIMEVLHVDANFLWQDEMNANGGFPLNLQYEELEHIKKYRLLDEYGKIAVNLVLGNELQRTKEQKKERQKNMFVREQQASYLCSPAERTYPKGIYQIDDFKNDEENRISMPVYDIGVSAGTGVFLDTPCYEVISMPEDRLSRKANFALWVTGDSMEPRFHDGDLVLVKIQPSVEIGEIGIFVLNGEGYIKKFGGDKLISLNPVYEPIIITEDDALYCKGKVIGNA